MLYRKFADTDIDISVLGFGTAGIGLSGYIQKDFKSLDAQEESVKALGKALELGLNLFDTAPAYGNKISDGTWPTDRLAEKLLGKVIPSVRRDKIFIATKNQLNWCKPEQIESSLYESLELLKTDYVDLFQFHGGNYRESQYSTWVTDEMVQVLHELKKEGVVRYLGISGYREGGILAAVDTGIYQSVMPQYNIFYRGAEWELLEAARNKKISVFPMRPLTGGEMEKFIHEIDTEKVLKVNPYYVAMKYVLKHAAVTSVPVGMRTVREVEENVMFVESLKGVIEGYDGGVGKRLL